MLDINVVKAMIAAVVALISVVISVGAPAQVPTDDQTLSTPVTEIAAPTTTVAPPVRTTAPAPTAIAPTPTQDPTAQTPAETVPAPTTAFPTAASPTAESPTAEGAPAIPDDAATAPSPEELAPAPAAPSAPSAPAGPPTAATDRPFDATSAWNSPIPANPVLDGDSAAMASNLAGGGTAALNDYGVPVYEAPAGTERFNVPCSTDWGPCPFDSDPAPLSPEFKPAAGTDGAMVVIDRSVSPPKLYEFWVYDWNGGSPTTAWGAVGPWTGTGIDGQDGRVGNSVGAGISRLAGVVRAHEIEAGVIDHALVFSTSFCKVDEVRAPAQKTDGKYSGAGAVPEGARVQLDPALNPDDFELSKAERAVFVAMQKYGAYAIDCGGDPSAYIFEAPSGGNDPYAAAGITGDYQKLNLPWEQVRVLQQWDGA